MKMTEADFDALVDRAMSDLTPLIVRVGRKPAPLRLLSPLIIYIEFRECRFQGIGCLK